MTEKRPSLEERAEQHVDVSASRFEVPRPVPAPTVSSPTPRETESLERTYWRLHAHAARTARRYQDARDTAERIAIALHQRGRMVPLPGHLDDAQLADLVYGVLANGDRWTAPAVARQLRRSHIIEDEELEHKVRQILLAMVAEGLAIAGTGGNRGHYRLQFDDPTADATGDPGHEESPTDADLGADDVYGNTQADGELPKGA